MKIKIVEREKDERDGASQLPKLGVIVEISFFSSINFFGLEGIVISRGSIIGFVKDDSVSSYTPKPVPYPHAFLPLKTLPHWFSHVLSRWLALSLMVFVANSMLLVGQSSWRFFNLQALLQIQVA